MASIECPRCGTEVSDQAKACPECGFSVRVAVLARRLEGYKKESPKAYTVLKLVTLIIFVSVVGWLLLRH